VQRFIFKAFQQHLLAFARFNPWLHGFMYVTQLPTSSVLETKNVSEISTGNSGSPLSTGPWWKELNRYHWFVLIVAALGWLFDCLDQQLFNLARVPAMRDLLSTPGNPATDPMVAKYGGLATSIFLIGWATGGLTFGVL